MTARPPRRPRSTIRRLMLLVTGLAFLCGAASWLIRTTERSSRFQRLADRHAQAYCLHRGKVETYPALAAPLENRGLAPEAIEKFLGGTRRDVELRDYHAGLKAKYERLAFYPWLTATPDPPEPE